MNYKQTLNELTKHDYKRYARHLVLPEIQVVGQERLQNAKILFIGAGGLASSTLLYLVSSGLGTIGIVDNDKIEISNLHRQIIYSEADIGLNKVDAAKKNLLKINSKCHIATYNINLNSNNAEYLIRSYDIIVDSTDNFKSRDILSKICKKLHKVHIYGAIGAFEGQVSIFNYRGGLSYNEIFPLEKQKIIQGCSGEGVIAVLPGLIGIIQATEVIKIITGIGDTLSGTMLVYNALDMSFRILRLQPMTKDDKYKKDFVFKVKFDDQRSINIMNINDLYNSIIHADPNICLIDIRNILEYNTSHLNSAINIPLTTIKDKKTLKLLNIISMKKYIVIYCNSIARSYVASNILQEQQIIHWILKVN